MNPPPKNKGVLVFDGMNLLQKVRLYILIRKALFTAPFHVKLEHFNTILIHEEMCSL